MKQKKNENNNYESLIIEKLPGANGNAYSESKRLYDMIKVTPENIIFDSKDFTDKRIVIGKINKCECIAKNGEDYVVNCAIPQRGFFGYLYNCKERTISRTQTNLDFVLTESAIRTIEKAINIFDNKVFSILKDNVNGDIEYNYRRYGSKYDFVVSKYQDGQRNISLFSDIDISTLLSTAQDAITGYHYPMNVIELEQNVLFQIALQKNDKKTQIWIQNYYTVWIGKYKKIQNKPKKSRTLLAVVSSEFDRDYIVDASTVKVNVLHKSGYRIHFRSAYTNFGNIHYWRLNPYKRTAYEGAPNVENPIAFCDYLDMFSTAHEN